MMQRKMRKRNTAAFTAMAVASFVLGIGFILVGIYNADWPLMEKGYYAGCVLWTVSSAIVLQKVIRDNAEDKEMYEESSSNANF